MFLLCCIATTTQQLSLLNCNSEFVTLIANQRETKPDAYCVVELNGKVRVEADGLFDLKQKEGHFFYGFQFNKQLTDTFQIYHWVNKDTKKLLDTIDPKKPIHISLHRRMWPLSPVFHWFYQNNVKHLEFTPVVDVPSYLSGHTATSTSSSELHQANDQSYPVPSAPTYQEDEPACPTPSAPPMNQNRPPPYAPVENSGQTTHTEETEVPVDEICVNLPGLNQLDLINVWGKGSIETIDDAVSPYLKLINAREEIQYTWNNKKLCLQSKNTPQEATGLTTVGNCVVRGGGTCIISNNGRQTITLGNKTIVLENDEIFVDGKNLGAKEGKKKEKKTPEIILCIPKYAACNWSICWG